MARQRVKVEMLDNHWARVTRAGVSRMVPPDGMLSMLESATALGTYFMRLDRLVKRGRLRTAFGPSGHRLVPLAEIRRLKRIGLAAA